MPIIASNSPAASADTASSTSAPTSSATLSPSLPLRRDTDSASEIGGAATFLILALSIAAIWAAGWALVRNHRLQRRFLPALGGIGGTGQSKTGKWWQSLATTDGVQILQSKPLTARVSVHVLQWDGKEWLLGCADNAIEVIGQRSLANKPSSQEGDA